MPKKDETMKKTEEFVQRVLSKTFNQRVDKETLRSVAEKVSEAVSINNTPTDKKVA